MGQGSRSEADGARLTEGGDWLDRDSEGFIEDIMERLVGVNGAQGLTTNARFMRRRLDSGGPCGRIWVGCPHRLVWSRTRAFQARGRGSNPLGGTSPNTA